MATTRTLDCMAELYQGECFGELLLDAEMAEFADPVARHLLGAIAQFETETKARLRPVMVLHETTILEAMDRAIAGELNPTRGVDALLHLPLPRPG